MKVHMFIFKLNECEFAGFIDLKKIHTSGWMIHGCDRITPLFLIPGAKNMICSSRDFVEVSSSFLYIKSNCVLISKHILTCSLTSCFIFFFSYLRSLILSKSEKKTKQKNLGCGRLHFSTILN